MSRLNLDLQIREIPDFFALTTQEKCVVIRIEVSLKKCNFHVYFLTFKPLFMQDNLITLEEAIELTAYFKQESNNVLDPDYQNKGILPTCETFSRELFDTLLSYPDCAGIRIYSGMDSNKNQKFIVVGVNANDEDVYITQEETPGVLYAIENGYRCPINCPPTSELNS